MWNKRVSLSWDNGTCQSQILIFGVTTRQAKLCWFFCKLRQYSTPDPNEWKLFMIWNYESIYIYNTCSKFYLSLCQSVGYSFCESQMPIYVRVISPLKALSISFGTILAESSNKINNHLISNTLLFISI